MIFIRRTRQPTAETGPGAKKASLGRVQGHSFVHTPRALLPSYLVKVLLEAGHVCLPLCLHDDLGSERRVVVFPEHVICLADEGGSQLLGPQTTYHHRRKVLHLEDLSTSPRRCGSQGPWMILAPV